MGRPVMATSTIALARFSAGKMGLAGLVTLALAEAVAVASPAAADPTGIAVVEALTVGTQRSEVQSGHVRRIEGHCYSGRMELTGEEAHVGGRVFRGPAH